MPKWLRALIAGYGAKKLGGGCLSTIMLFIIIYYALGQCNRPAAPANVPVQSKSAANLLPKAGSANMVLLEKSVV